MEIGLIGLGKMGYNLALNLSDHGHTVIGTDVRDVTSDTFTIVPTLEDVVSKLSTPRVIWAMVPARDVTAAVLAELYERLEPGDIVIDGGNSNYKLSVARAEQFAEKKIKFFDCGTSGGTEGARNGACTMVGEDADAWPTIEPLFKDLSVENGYLYTGPTGSGHFLKMLEVSGGAERLAQTLVNKFGEDKAQWALGITGFIVAVPVFFDVGFIILVPIVYGLAKKTGRSLLYYGIPLLAGLAVTHSFIPPTPDPIAVANLIGADLGRVILFGVIAGIPTMILAGPVLGKYIAKKIHVTIPDYMECELLTTYLLHKLKWELLGKTVLSPATVMDQARRVVPTLKEFVLVCQHQ